MTFSKRQAKTLYQTDYLCWIEATLQNLRSRCYDSVDWENLIEEIEAMGKRERRSLESNLVVILLHLLKWQFQPKNRTGSGSRSIAEHRRRVTRLLQDSPSLKPYCDRLLPDCYASAREQAHLETGLPLNSFPPNCPYAIADILDRTFWPNSR